MAVDTIARALALKAEGGNTPPDLSNYVQFSDFATPDKAGVINSGSNGFSVDASGNTSADVYTSEQYGGLGDNSFISKGTLENIKDDYVGSSTPVQDLTTTVTNVQDDQDEGILKQTVSGEMITVDDAIAYKIFNVTVDGASEQETTSGKNLLNLDVTPANGTANGMTMSFDKDKQILTLDGTIPTGQTSNYLFTFNEPLVIEPGNYTFLAKHLGGNGTVENPGRIRAIRLVSSAGDNIDISSQDGSLVISSQDYQFTEQKIIEKIQIIIYPTISLNNYQLGLYFGKKNTEYEPYTGGQPSPSPDYPQPITTLTFSKITRCGKNLYNVTDINTYYTTAVGEDVSVDEEGWITIDVDNSQSSSEKFNDYWTNFSHLLKPNANYNIFLEIKEVSGTSGYISVTNETYNSQFNNAFSLNLKDISGNSIKNKICITKQNYMEENMTMLRTFLSTPANSKNKITFRISVIEDTTVTPQNFVYEPYQATEYTIDLQGNEMVEISNGVKDELVIDKYGNVSLIKNVGKYFFDGSEDWSSIPDTDMYWEFMYIFPTGNQANYTYSLSNYFSNEDYNRLICIGLEVYIRFPKNIGIDVSDAEKFKSWLQSHNTIAYYELTEPQTISLGTLSELITTLNGTNNISINGNIPTTISTTYALDIKKYVDNKIAELSAQLIKGE